MAVEGTINVNLTGGAGGGMNIGGLAAALGGKGGAGGLLGGLGLGGMGKVVPILGAMAGMLGALVASSKMLQSVLGNIVKMVMLVIRPIGDILAVGLLPIIYLLRPVALFFNTIMRPFVQKALMAMKAGGVLLKEGKTEEATGAFMLGTAFVLQPFVNAILTGISAIIPGSQAIMDTFAAGLNDALESRLGYTLATTAELTDTNTARWLESFTKTGGDMTNIMKGVEDYAKANTTAIGNILTGFETVMDSKAKRVVDMFNDMFNQIISRGSSYKAEAERLGIDTTMTGGPKGGMVGETLNEWWDRVGPHG